MGNEPASRPHSPAPSMSPTGNPVPALASRTMPKNSLMLSTSGCLAKMRDTSVDPHRPVPTTNVISTNRSITGRERQIWNEAPRLVMKKCSICGYDPSMTAYVPPGWPAGVHPPGSEEFESTAVAWLLDVVPPDYRLHGVLRRYPIALAALARYHSKACVEGARQGYRAARTELDALPPHAIDSVLAAYRKEGARLAATARAVGLVERALRGETFTPKMPHEGVPTGQPPRGRASTPKTP